MPDLEPPSAVAERVLDECVDPDREVPFHFKLDHDKATALIAADRRAAVTEALRPFRELATKLHTFRRSAVVACEGSAADAYDLAARMLDEQLTAAEAEGKGE